MNTLLDVFQNVSVSPDIEDVTLQVILGGLKLVLCLTLASFCRTFFLQVLFIK